jgi:DNA-binding response OmpR family regulator
METTNTAGGGKIILVAEDDKFLSNVYIKKLTKEGYQVEHANNGEEALQAARAKKPDLILMDLMMPVKDGFEALKEMKEDAALKDIKVIILSNLSQEEDQKRVLGMGAVEYVVKANVSFHEVIDIIKKHLA